MPFDVGNKIDRDRLRKAITTSKNVLVANFARSRTEMIRDFVGSWYSPTGARYLTYVNGMRQTAHILTDLLSYNNPLVKVTTWEPDCWPFAHHYQVNINKVVANIDFKTTFQGGVLDAFFLMGIFNIRMEDIGERETSEPNVWIDPGTICVQRVSFDNAILDLSAADIRTMRFFGHRYRASYDRVRERDDYDRSVRNRLSPTSKFGYQVGSEYADQIASGNAVDDDELYPMIWLENIYLPETKELVTFCPDQEDLPPLKVERQDQGPFGPYEFLSLGLVPDNVIPSSPASNLKALNDLRNRLYRKLSAQATRQKNNVGYRAGSEKQAERVKNAKDGEYIALDDPDSLVPVSFPGVDGNTHAFYLAADEVFNAEAGNIRTLGGLGRETDTVRQEQQIESHAMGMIAGMKAAVNQCAANICRKIGALMWDDEFLKVESSFEAENTGYQVPPELSSWEPGKREGIKDQYVFSVEPNSMGYRPQEAKVKDVLDYLQLVPNLLPLVQLGILDIQELTRFVSEYRNVPELPRFFKFMSPQLMGAMGGGDMHGATKPPTTTRNVVRSSGAGPTRSGAAAVASQFLQGKFGPPQGVTVGGAR